MALTSQLQFGTCQEHLPEQQQKWHFPSASAEVEPCAAAVDLQHFPPEAL